MAVAVIPNQPRQHHQHLCMCNGTINPNGGSHHTGLLQQIYTHLRKKIKEIKKDVPASADACRNSYNILLFVVLENPKWRSQDKEYLSSRLPSTPDYTLPPAFLNALARNETVRNNIRSALNKKNDLLRQRSDPLSLQSRVSIPNTFFRDAPDAASPGKDCLLLLCEGNSAASMLVDALSSSPHSARIGAYPLRGFVENFNEVDVEKMLKSRVLQHLKLILGIKDRVKQSPQQLRYRYVAFAVDADSDGSHIMFLLMNLFARVWPHLVEPSSKTGVPQLMLFKLCTPLVRCTLKPGYRAQVPPEQHTLEFFSEDEYNRYRAGEASSNTPPADWYISSFFKGLGSHGAKEARDFFHRLDRYLSPLVWRDMDDARSIRLVCSQHPTAANVRKQFYVSRNEQEEQALREFRDSFASLLEEPEEEAPRALKDWLPDTRCSSFLGPATQTLAWRDIVFRDFPNVMDEKLARSLPQLPDGLKDALRKIVWTLRNQSQEIRVANAASKVTETTDYHHGEVSLAGAIVLLARNFPGTNNVPLLGMRGMFGSREIKDSAAQPRYIFCRMEEVGRALFGGFRSDAVVPCHVSDGRPLEPQTLVPVLPPPLLNGCEGLGIG